ncbi:TPA_asm: maturation protein [ssRNA phage Gerhypos.2_38]|uniref:Maturation protein n=3 Tax=Norzivirales TaxID=2842247 RepID=A0A8S5KXM5_9VIRU|nr:maturation protein [ssRNA phage Gerhypos.2_38]QDH89636.1 MAG: hypothetical protein H2Bulk3671_000002 [Leviviridae sp.]DAD50510.1 TPA_asm: maturation protein [ssRNA phage Gerhypos.2_38]
MKTKQIIKQCDISYEIDYSHYIVTPTSTTFDGGKLQRVDLVAAVVSDLTFGDNIADWKDVIRRGDNATTSMTGTTKRASRTNGHLDGQVRFSLIADPNWKVIWLYTGYGVFAPYALFSTTSIPTSSATAENRALARFNAKAASVNRQFQGGVFFAELHKTLHGLRHPAEALFKGIETYSRAATKLRTRIVKNRDHYRSLTKTQRRSVGKSFTEAATGLWLENSFHWLPLMYDIQGAVSALEASFDGMPSVFVKVSANDVQTTTSDLGSNAVSFVLLPYSLTEKTGASVRMYGRVRVRTRLPFWPDMASLGFDPRSFVPTIWELIPYSWAVDYFTNIGDIIYGMSQGGCDVAWSARGISRYVRRTLIAQPALTKIVPPPGYKTDLAYLTGSPSEWTSEKATISRATYVGSYIPSLEWKVPGLSLKWLNLGAAFLQRSLAFL